MFMGIFMLFAKSSPIVVNVIIECVSYLRFVIYLASFYYKIIEIHCKLVYTFVYEGF